MNIQELKQIVAEAGVVGAGGAGFPSYMKLAEGADSLIINAVECEPLLYTDYYIMKRHMDEILAGAEHVIEATGIKDGYLGIKRHTAERLGLVHNQQMSKHVKVYAVPDVYPMGDEIILIYEVLHRVVQPGSLPLTAGVLVFNAETLMNIDHAVKTGEGVHEKWLTIGGKIDNPVTLKVPMGAAVKDLLASLNISVPADCAVINGGPAMGGLMDVNTAVVTKTTKGILFLPKELPIVAGKMASSTLVVNRASSTCCQCTLCTEMCPRALIGYPLEPHKAVRSAIHHVMDNPAEFTNATVCSGCGVCELTACCQGLSPRRVYQEMKGILAKNKMRYQHTGAPVEAKPERDYRLLPSERFKSRVGLTKYDRMPAFIENPPVFDQVELNMSQHIGAPAVPVVAVGDTVQKGMVIGKAAEGLSVNIHCSMDGKVQKADGKSIVVSR